MTNMTQHKIIFVITQDFHTLFHVLKIISLHQHFHPITIKLKHLRSNYTLVFSLFSDPCCLVPDDDGVNFLLSVGDCN